MGRRAPTRVKVIATHGPACASAACLGRMIHAGMHVLRINFSHGTRDDHMGAVDSVRKAAKKAGRPVAVLADLQGPRLRVGDLAAPLVLKRGETVRLAPAREARSGDIPVTYRNLATDISPQDPILLDDGRLELVAVRRRQGVVTARVKTGGILRTRKGMNLPSTDISAPAVSRKDLADLETAREAGVDYVGLSFTRSAEDIVGLRRRMRRRGWDAGIVAKIERPEAVASLAGILEVSDAVMVARGDLGVEVGVAKVPALQKRIIARSVEARRPVITATQMLESMIENPGPTRAEANDVANAVLDGTSAVMLSAETAIGKHPVEAVRVLRTLVHEAEGGLMVQPRRRSDRTEQGVDDAAARAAVEAAEAVGARVLVAFTESGSTARLLSSLRPNVPIAGCSRHRETLRRLALVWGVRPLRIPIAENTADLYRMGARAIRRARLAKNGDRIVFVSGRTSVSGATNTVRIHTLGKRAWM